MPNVKEREPLLSAHRGSSFDEDEVGRQLKEPLKAQPFMKDFFKEEEAKKKQREEEERIITKNIAAKKKAMLDAKDRWKTFTQLSLLGVGFLLLIAVIGIGIYEAWSYFTASTLGPTSSPSMLPSSMPSISPSPSPTSSRPTPNPSIRPTQEPTQMPTTPKPSILFDERTFVPTTPGPTNWPTRMPTLDPTVPAPTPIPSLYRWPPTRLPTPKPIDSLTARPLAMYDDDLVAGNGETPPSGWSPKRSKHKERSTNAIRSGSTSTRDRALRFLRSRHKATPAAEP